jgi:hypothetical protein
MKKSIYMFIFSCLFSAFLNAQDRTESFEIDSLTGDFTVRVTLTPSEDVTDAAFGLGPVSLTGWGDFNCIVRFNTNGVIDARNGAGYEALNELAYQANTRYYITMSGNIDSSKYSVTAREEGDTAVVIAEDYAFRSNNYQGFFKYASERAVVGSLGVSNFQIGSEVVNDHDNFNVKLDKPLVGDYAVKLRATPSASNMNGGIGLSKKMMTGWGDFNNIISFAADGTIKIHNGSGYSNDTVFYYEGGQDYTFFIWGNTDSTKYNVKLVTTDGQILDLATNYNFRLSNPGDTLNYVAQRIVYASKDNGIQDSYIAIDGIEFGSLLDIDPFPMLAIPQEMEIQTGTFSKTFVLTPSSDEMDHSISFNSSSSVLWGDLSAIIRFAGGKIDARDGGKYTYVNEVMYEAGQAYIFDAYFNVDSNTYSVFVKTEVEGTSDTIAFDYGFRKAPVDTIMYMTFKGNPSKGFLTYSEVAIGNYYAVHGADGCQAPVMDAVEDVIIRSNSGTQTINLTGISDASGDDHLLEVTAFSSDTLAIPNPVVSEVTAEGTAVLTYVVNQVAENTDVTITLVVSTDCDIVTMGGVASSTSTFKITVSTTSNIHKNELSGISVYPNPAVNSLTVKNAASITKVEIYSLIGEKVIEHIHNGNETSELDISELEKGAYVVRCLNGNAPVSSALFIKE